MKTPIEIVNDYSKLGEKKCNNSIFNLLLLGILAGSCIALAGVASTVAIFKIENASIAKLVSSAIFPSGLIIIILIGAELFTGNCLIFISFLNKKVSFFKMIYNWVIVYLGNFIGAVIVSFGYVELGQLNLDNMNLAVFSMKVASGKCSLTIFQAIGLGLFCNILVTLAILLSMSALTTIGKIFSSFVPVFIFVLCGFEHSIANMYYISVGLFAKNTVDYSSIVQYPNYNLDNLNLFNFVAHNLLPVTIGNILGGLIISYIMFHIYLKNYDKCSLYNKV